MTDQEEFERFWKIHGQYFDSKSKTLTVWQACAEQKNAVIERQAKELEALRKALLDIYNAIPPVCEWDAADQFYNNLLIDENGDPTPLLTGEK